mmetsp:Transcript_8782/g.25268  ORF Transcript_8782/g.25268 Transcript_8782/m.25268 type:complete len:237 (-) Transcript_8782:142-852(-)
MEKALRWLDVTALLRQFQGDGHGEARMDQVIRVLGILKGWDIGKFHDVDVDLEGGDPVALLWRVLEEHFSEQVDVLVQPVEQLAVLLGDAMAFQYFYRAHLAHGGVDQEILFVLYEDIGVLLEVRLRSGWDAWNCIFRGLVSCIAGLLQGSLFLHRPIRSFSFELPNQPLQSCVFGGRDGVVIEYFRKGFAIVLRQLLLDLLDACVVLLEHSLEIFRVVDVAILRVDKGLGVRHPR